MDILQWRGKARVVAYVDMILTSISLLGNFLVAIFAGGLLISVANNPEVFTQVAKGLDAGGEFQKMNAANLAIATGWIIWLVVVVAAILACIQWWAAHNLLNATDIGRQFHDALSRARTWRVVTIVFLIFDVVGLFNRPYFFIVSMIDILIRCVFLFIVQKFMSEVNSCLTTSSFPGPTVVIVKS